MTTRILLALLLSVSCWSTPRSTIPTHSTQTRGPLVVREYTSSVEGHPHAGETWCDLEIAGVPYDPFPCQLYRCDVAPWNPPSVVLGVSKGADAGVYVVTVNGTHPTIREIVGEGELTWTEGGRYLVQGTQALEVATGTVVRLPPYPGTFLTFDPEGTSFIAVEETYVPEHPEQDEGIFHQVSMAAGTMTTQRYVRAEVPWLWDGTHEVALSVYTPRIWQAAHLRWEKGPDGTWRYAVGGVAPEPPPDDPSEEFPSADGRPSSRPPSRCE